MKSIVLPLACNTWKMYLIIWTTCLSHTLNGSCKLEIVKCPNSLNPWKSTRKQTRRSWCMRGPWCTKGFMTQRDHGAQGNHVVDYGVRFDSNKFSSEVHWTI